jgi:hypothetical protein
LNLIDLHAFAIRAKKATYIGSGAKAPSSRLGSHDLTYAEGDWRYRDSYFGGTDFLGQEVIWLRDTPVWAMNYHGYILRDDLSDAAKAGATLKEALAQPNTQGRLLDNLIWQGPFGLYAITSSGNITRFKGRETITVAGTVAYALDYQGGLINP